MTSCRANSRKKSVWNRVCRPVSIECVDQSQAWVLGSQRLLPHKLTSLKSDRWTDGFKTVHIFVVFKELSEFYRNTNLILLFLILFDLYPQSISLSPSILWLYLADLMSGHLYSSFHSQTLWNLSLMMSVYVWSCSSNIKGISTFLWIFWRKYLSFFLSKVCLCDIKPYSKSSSEPFTTWNGLSMNSCFIRLWILYEVRHDPKCLGIFYRWDVMAIKITMDLESDIIWYIWLHKDTTMILLIHNEVDN